jgi:hypothetical protein
MVEIVEIESGVPENGISFAHAFERVFNAVRPDAKELRNAAVIEMESKTYDGEMWQETLESWDAARRQVWKLFRDELAYCLGDPLIAHKDGKQLRQRYWEDRFGPEDVEESIYFRKKKFERWLKRFEEAPPKGNAGRKPPYGLREFVFDRMGYHGPFSDDDPSWNCQARLEGEIIDKFKLSEGRARHWAKTYLEEWEAFKARN